jgi:hypothetical protein
VATCDCGEETSCYGCLQNYRNQTVHDILRRDLAIKVLRRIGPATRAEEPTDETEHGPTQPLSLDPGTILVDTFNGQTTAMILADGQVLMHGEIYADAQRAADAVDHEVNARDFWAAELPEGRRPLRELMPRQ